MRSRVWLTVKMPSQGNKLLIVHDNEDMCRYLQQLFNQQYDCLLAGSGQQAIELAVAQMPDLIVVMIPTIDGFELTDKLKNSQATSHIPIILLTAKGDRQSRLTGLQHQADGYFSKPFDEDELQLTIANLLRLRDNIKGYWGERALPDAAKPVETSPIVFTIKEQQFLDKVQRSIAKYYHDPEVSVETLAAEVAVTSRQLRRKLKALTGFTPNVWLLNYRLEQAKILLVTVAELSEVAYAVGFDSYSYFGRCFRQKFAMTPKEYRQQARQTSGSGIDRY